MRFLLRPGLSRQLLRAHPPWVARRFPPVRRFSTSRPTWTPPHVEYPSTPTKETSYATPLLALPSPPTQPTSNGLLLLYVPYPPDKWPSHIEIEDKFVDGVGKAVALKGVRMIVCHDGSSGEGYRAKLLVPGGLVESYLAFNEQTLESPEFTETLSSLSTRPPSLRQLDYSEILICTHGARDCRCSDIGGDLAIALRHEVARRGEELLGPGEPAEKLVAKGSNSKWKVTECAHVGGHKWAANAILLPTLTFLSNLRPTHAPLIIDHLANPSDATLKAQLWAAHFRGIIGVQVEDQVKAYESTINPPPPVSEESQTSIPPTTEGAPTRICLPVRFTTHDGTTHDVFGYTGESLMEIAKREGLGAIEGTCGGHLECATCHMYIPYNLIDDPSTRIADLSDSEEDMLDYAMAFREEQSRLGCQILLSSELSEWSMRGGGVELPEY